MNKFLVCLTLLLSSCYLANGSPSSVNFWIRDNKKFQLKKSGIVKEKRMAS